MCSAQQEGYVSDDQTIQDSMITKGRNKQVDFRVGRGQVEQVLSGGEDVVCQIFIDREIYGWHL